MKPYLIPMLALVSCLAAASAYLFFLHAVEENAGRIEAAALEAATLTKKNSALQAGGAMLDETRGLRAALNTFVSTDAEVVKSITLLEQAGRMSRVELTLGAVGVSKPDSLRYHELITIAFAAQGSFAEIMKLISLLESVPHISRLDNVVIETQEGSLWSMNALIVYAKEKP